MARVDNVMTATTWLVLGSLAAGAAVALGAFAAHQLDTRLPRMYEGQTREVAGVTIPAAQKYLADFRTAAEYQMYHGLALLAVGLLMQAHTSPPTGLTIAGVAFTAGIVIFCGCLYALVLTGQRWLGAVVPIGGICFLIGWTALAISVWTLPAIRRG